MQTVKVPESSIEDRKKLAREHSALFPTRLALARWTNGDVPHLHDAHPPLQRAAWLANVQRDYQAWLDSGGFTQHKHDAPPRSGPGSHVADEWAI